MLINDIHKLKTGVIGKKLLTLVIFGRITILKHIDNY